jgi:hypothetical protein
VVAACLCLAAGGATKSANGRAIEQVVLYCICSESKELVLVEMKLDAQDASNDHAIEQLSIALLREQTNKTEEKK